MTLLALKVATSQMMTQGKGSGNAEADLEAKLTASRKISAISMAWRKRMLIVLDEGVLIHVEFRKESNF